VEEIAKHLGIVKDSVDRWIETKSLPTRKVGRHWELKLPSADESVWAGGPGTQNEPKYEGDR